jgi:hypothetical protein
VPFVAGVTEHSALLTAILENPADDRPGWFLRICSGNRMTRMSKPGGGSSGVAPTKAAKPDKSKSKTPCPACGVEGFAKGGKCSVCGHEAKATVAKPADGTTAPETSV